MFPYARVIIVILDGVGVGEAPDAEAYGDAGANSISNTARAVGGIRLPHLQRMGLGNLTHIDGVPAEPAASACYGVMRPAAAGKDSTSGHWELAGCIVEQPFPVYAGGFPPELIQRFETVAGRGVIGNCPASGTEIIQRLGERHCRTGELIVYTSQDSVFQIAAHETVVPVDELYRICEAARALLKGPHAVGRVIARPFAGEVGGFYRTARRRDFSLPPPGPTVLDALTKMGKQVLAIGKVGELFAGRGITRSIKTRDNADGMAQTLEALLDDWQLVVTNLVDFDTMWGHRNDPRAYALGLEEFDAFVPELCGRMPDDGLLIVTSDHGNDPTSRSSDHSRECVPLLVWSKRGRTGVDLGTRTTFADVAATVADAQGVDVAFPGESFLANVSGG